MPHKLCYNLLNDLTLENTINVYTTAVNTKWKSTKIVRNYRLL